MEDMHNDDVKCCAFICKCGLEYLILIFELLTCEQMNIENHKGKIICGTTNVWGIRISFSDIVRI